MLGGVFTQILKYIGKGTPCTFYAIIQHVYHQNKMIILNQGIECVYVCFQFPFVVTTVIANDDANTAAEEDKGLKKPSKIRAFLETEAWAIMVSVAMQVTTCAML